MYVKVLTSKSLDFLYLQAGYYRGFSVARLLHRIRICLSLTFPFLGQFMFLILQIHCRYIFFWGFLFILVIASTSSTTPQSAKKLIILKNILSYFEAFHIRKKFSNFSVIAFATFVSTLSLEHKVFSTSKKYSVSSSSKIAFPSFFTFLLTIKIFYTTNSWANFNYLVEPAKWSKTPFLGKPKLFLLLFMQI